MEDREKVDPDQSGDRDSAGSRLNGSRPLLLVDQGGALRGRFFHREGCGFHAGHRAVAAPPGSDPRVVAKELGFEALGSDTLAAVVADVVAAHPDEWTRYVGGDDKLTGFFTGAVMKATSGKANGKEVAAELRRLRS